MQIPYVADLAYAAGQPLGGGGAGSAMVQVAFLAAIFAIFYILLIRPQQKQRKERERMLSVIKRGDRVVTSGGLHGTIVGLNEHTVMLKVGDQVKLEFDRSAIGRVVSRESEKEGA